MFCYYQALLKCLVPGDWKFYFTCFCKLIFIEKNPANSIAPTVLSSFLNQMRGLAYTLYSIRQILKLSDNKTSNNYLEEGWVPYS